MDQSDKPVLYLIFGILFLVLILVDPERRAKAGTVLYFYAILGTAVHFALIGAGIFLILRIYRHALFSSDGAAPQAPLPEPQRDQSLPPQPVIFPADAEKLPGTVVKSALSADKSEYHLLIETKQPGSHPVFYLFRLPPDAAETEPGAGAAVMLCKLQAPSAEPFPLPQDDTGTCLLLPGQAISS